MKKHNLLAFILLGASIVSCGDDDKEKNNLFRIDTAAIKQQYHSGESFSLSVINEKNKEIDSVAYYLNDTKAGTATGNSKVTINLDEQKFGYKNLKALVFYNGGDNAETSTRIEVVSNIEPTLLKYEIVNTFEHDPAAYTQGLEFYRDTLVEGTGQYRKSSLRKIDYKTGKIYKQVKLEDKYFGEGITALNGKIYQLTYREKTGFVYNAETLEKIKEFTYFKDIEGWGLTNDGKHLYMSDGSEKIYMLDPETLKEVDYINVYTMTTKIKAVNELEWINGKIYGNVYLKDAVAVIDPATGAVEHIIDFSKLKSLVTYHPELDVLNGIAYNPKSKTIFVTGKNWDKMFEVRIID